MANREDDSTGMIGNKEQSKPKRGHFELAKYRGYSIPQIDLDDREEFHVVVSKDPDTYMGHPSSVLLDDGQTMVMMYLDHHGRGTLMWRRSEDGGRTWSEHLPVPDGWNEPTVVKGEEKDPFLEVPIIYKINGSDGKQRICMYTAGRSDYPTRYAVSEDGGQTWSEKRPLMFGGKELFNTVVLFSDMIRLIDGSYMATWHSGGGVYVATTTDGLTFSEPRLVLPRRDKAHLCEACLLRSPDGEKIAMLLRENSRNYNSFISFSEDEGKTWSEPRQMPDSLTGDRHQHTYAPDGRLFITFRDRGAQSPTSGDWVGWVGSFEDLLKGSEGQYRVRLKDNHKGADCAYPTQHLLPDGTIFAATYGSWAPDEQHSILAVLFRIEQLDELVGQMPRG